MTRRVLLIVRGKPAQAQAAVEAAAAQARYWRANGAHRHHLTPVAGCRYCARESGPCDGRECAREDVPQRGLRQSNGYYLCALCAEIAAARPEDI